MCDETAFALNIHLQRETSQRCRIRVQFFSWPVPANFHPKILHSLDRGDYRTQLLKVPIDEFEDGIWLASEGQV